MKKVSIPLVILFVLLVSGFPAFSQQASQPPQNPQEATPVSVHQISPHVYEVRGGDGANCSFIVGEKEIFVIDAKMSAQSAKKMIALIKKTTNKRISHIILTHSDEDHVNGLSVFSGIPVIIAHAYCAKDIEKANESQAKKLPLPNETFDGRMSIYSGKFQIDLLYFGPAHTDGDIVILVPEDKVAIVGDLFFKKMDPIIHINKNGTSFGLVNALDRIAELDAQIYLSGHAEPVAKTEIEALRKRIVETQGKVKTMVEENKTLDEVKKALGVSTGESRWPSLADIIYLELTRVTEK